jgi:hypothetical protein
LKACSQTIIRVVVLTFASAVGTLAAPQHTQPPATSQPKSDQAPAKHDDSKPQQQETPPSSTSAPTNAAGTNKPGKQRADQRSEHVEGPSVFHFAEFSDAGVRWAGVPSPRGRSSKSSPALLSTMLSSLGMAFLLVSARLKIAKPVTDRAPKAIQSVTGRHSPTEQLRIF